jgi:hypothetical protein
LEDGQELLVLVDTGAPVSALDKQHRPAAHGSPGHGLHAALLHPTGLQAYGCEATFGGETYTDLILAQAPPLVVGGRTNYLNAIGLPFLSRHLVTLDFPRRTMFLRKGLSP